MKEPFDDLETLAKEAGLSQVSPNFLIQVMDSVRKEEALKTNEIQPYTPLLTVRKWIAIGVITFFILLVAIITEVGSNETTINFISMSKIKNMMFSFSLPDFVPYQTTVYSISFLILYFIIQVPVLKRRFDREFTANTSLK
ncbi:hypothetical protein ACJRPK_10080 [Aquimarina sp. 2-A2]|uniref:hypothetical protein n=1 Tax=Aquimarina sp. 2-A2 TaxID=3382644 RepID=UPI00387EEA88